MQLNYNQLDSDIEKRIISDRTSHWENPYRADDENALRRDGERDKSTLLRPSYARDIDKILHLPLYNRYNDKTQVFSLYRNDDITRRGLHVQLVSRIARNIGRLLGLNLDLIEAIALGHDIGHTPFGHAGERFLSELLYNDIGEYFNHNVQSVRVLDTLYRRNVSLQVLDGILCHNGEFELKEYRPHWSGSFAEFDDAVKRCDTDAATIKTLVPMTLEGCVVRVCDMIAYIGKDRQDAVTAKIISEDFEFPSHTIGSHNAELINNLVVDIVNNSYGKDCIILSEEAYTSLKTAKKENYSYIYFNSHVNEIYENTIKPMFSQMYERLRNDVIEKNESSVIYKHHIQYIEDKLRYYSGFDYLKENPCRIAADYLASMTDDYFVDLYRLLFPDSEYHIEYKSYFGNEKF